MESETLSSGPSFEVISIDMRGLRGRVRKKKKLLEEEKIISRV